MLVLAMEVAQPLPELPESAHGAGSIVEPYTAAAARGEIPAQHQPIGTLQPQFAQQFHERSLLWSVEDRRHFAASRTCADPFTLPAFTEHEGERVDHQGLAGTGGARNAGQTGCKFQAQIISDPEITDV
jgi:hypothetical protein